MTQSTESQANRDECVFPCRFSIWQVQTLGLLRDTSILMWPYSPRPVHSQCGGWLSLDIMCHLWKIPKTDTFTYTFSQLCLYKLFIIMAKLANARDSKSAPRYVAYLTRFQRPGR